MRRTSTTAAVAATLLVVALALAGCGSSGDGDTGAAVGLPDDGGTLPAALPASVPARCTSTEVVTMPYATVAGVDPDLLSVDVYALPDGCGPSPVVFWVHGGGWRTGDKANEGVDTKAAWAAAHGWTLVSVNYRLSTEGSGVMWPTHGQDVADAVSWTLEHSDRFGLDPGRVAIIGHSAGAHIASMVAVDPTLTAGAELDRSAVDCLVALDTEGYDVQERVDSSGEATDQMYTAAFGTDPAALAAASPLQVLQQAGGPVADAVIVTRGLPKRRAQAEAFADALRAAGSEVEVVDATGYSHADVNHQLGVPGETVETPTITAFLQRCLA
jgi:acetyl esterase/lipase